MLVLAYIATGSVAITFELLPERLTLVSAALEGAGLGGLGALGLARLGGLERAARDRLAELGNVVGAGFGAGLVVLGSLVQGLS